MSGDERDFNNSETRAVITFFFPARQGAEGNSLHSDRNKTATTPEIIDQIHELILEDRRISATSVAEQMGISREQVGSIMHEDLDMQKLSVKWVPKCLTRIKNVNGARRLSKFGIFSARSK
jgi:predicted HTH transcriptional regulator